MCQNLSNKVIEWDNYQLITINIIKTKQYKYCKFCNNKKYKDK